MRMLTHPDVPAMSAHEMNVEELGSTLRFLEEEWPELLRQSNVDLKALLRFARAKLLLAIVA